TWFVGRLGDQNQLAAVTLAFPLFLTLTAIANLFGIGGSSFVSRALGKRNLTAAKQGSAFAFYGGMALALCFSLGVFVFRHPLLILLGADSQTYSFTYDYVFWAIVIGSVPAVLNPILAHLIRGQGGAFHASIGMSLGGILNIVLDPFFIFPWGLGLQVAGAAMATAISNTVSCLYFLLYLYYKKNQSSLSLRPTYLKAPFTLHRELLSIGFPSFIQMFMSVLSNAVLNKLMSAYSANALSAVGIAKKIDTLPSAVTQGISGGSLPLLGYNHAAGKKERMKKAFRFSTALAIGFCSVFFLSTLLFAPTLVSWFLNDPEVVPLGASFLRLHALSMPFLALSFMVIALYQGAGNSRPALVLSLFRKGILDIPFMFVLNIFWPMYGLMAVQPIMDILSTFLSLYLYRRFWKKEI
ncbi:MAG: MATE family efflux transporter, partial [Clostridiales bacterium]|nr:MATE family efflux transporter [Clostridiales bacterium]